MIKKQKTFNSIDIISGFTSELSSSKNATEAISNIVRLFNHIHPKAQPKATFRFTYLDDGDIKYFIYIPHNISG